jgi:hypothetical protein
MDESTLLALVEGVLPLEQASVLRDQLAQGTPEQQRLLDRLDSMRRDRAGVASLAMAPMPLGMVEAAMRRAQQDALAGLRIAGEHAGDIPVSRVVPSRHRRWTGARRLTAVAALLGMIGGVTLIAVWPKKPSAGHEAVATNDKTGSNTGISTGGHGEKPSSIAVNDSATDADLRDGSFDGLQDPSTKVASSEPVDAVAVPMALSPLASADRAEHLLELAKAGRLVFKVTARTPRQSEQQLASLAARPLGTRAWNVSADAPVHVVASLALLSKPSSVIPQGTGPSESPMMADTSTQPRPMIVRPEAPLPMAVPPGAEDLVGLVRVVPTLDGIESVRRALTDAVGSVTVAELADPLAGMGTSEPITLESAIWWSGPPTRWATWASVPVIIER